MVNGRDVRDQSEKVSSCPARPPSHSYAASISRDARHEFAYIRTTSIMDEVNPRCRRQPGNDSRERRAHYLLTSVQEIFRLTPYHRRVDEPEFSPGRTRESAG